MMTLSTTCKCAWPAFYCPSTPEWQLFSSCMHERDSATSACWHSFRRPFPVPFGIPGHTCVWEKLDDHMAGNPLKILLLYHFMESV